MSFKKREKFLPFCIPTIEEEEINEVVATLKSGWITTGPRVRKFEEKFCEYQKTKNSIALTSATAGLHLSLLTLNLKSGDEVITPSMSWVSAANMIELTGGKPVFCDINQKTFQIDIDDVKKKITEKTKAIIPVHFAGQPYDIDWLNNLVENKNILIIEDAAHAVGTKYKNRFIGNDSDYCVFSFHPIKNITTGEGGILTCKNEETFERLKKLKFHGIIKDSWERYNSKGEFAYEVIEPGFKYNMMDIQAAIGLRQLKKLDKFIHTRKNLAERYNKLFEDLDEVKSQETVDYGCLHAHHLYILLIDIKKLDISRDKFMELLKVYNIGSGLHFTPVHLHKFYKDKYGYKKGSLPNTEHIGERMLSLPLFPNMTFDDQNDVVNSIKKIISDLI